MPSLIYVALASLPGGGTAYVGMAHAAEYRDDVIGYETINSDSGAACDICGLLLSECR